MKSYTLLLTIADCNNFLCNIESDETFNKGDLVICFGKLYWVNYRIINVTNKHNTAIVLTKDNPNK